MTLTIIPAGAGAGKTYRIQTQLTEWVRDKVVRPDRILAVTFTEAAAAELSGRIRQSLLAAGMIEEQWRSSGPMSRPSTALACG